MTHTNKVPITFRASDEAHAILKRIGERTGLADVAVFELAIRLLDSVPWPPAGPADAEQALLGVPQDVRGVPRGRGKGRPKGSGKKSPNP